MSLVLQTNKRQYGKAAGLLGAGGPGNIKLPNIIPKNINSNELTDVVPDKYETTNLLKQSHTQAI